jgi:hypothetical protein
MRRAALVGGLLVFVLGALVFARPFLTRDRDLLTSTPQPSPLTALAVVEVPGGAEACLDLATMDERSNQARFVVGSYHRRRPPLRLTIRGRGYRDSERIASGPRRDSSRRDRELLSVPVDAPDSAMLVTVCIRNGGRHRIALSASNDRTLSRSRTNVDGAPVVANFVLQFAEREPGSMLGHLAVILRRLTIFRPVDTWLLWPLAILFAVGLPVGVMFAFVRAAGSAEAEDAAARRALLAAGGAPPAPLRERYPLLARVVAAPRFWLALIVGAIFVLGARYALSLVEYFVMPDELGYVKQASHIASTWQPSMPGDMWFNSYAQLWSLLIAPAYGLLATPAAFDAAHLLGAAAFASAAIPAYLLAARVIEAPVGRLLAAALTVTVPWLAFAGSLMTETLGYPLFVWALLACCVAIERPSLARDAIALASIALAFLTRPQLAALAVALLGAAVLHELTFTDAGRRPRSAALKRLSRHALLLVLVVGGLVLVVAGVSTSAVLGNYASVTDGGLFVDGMVAQGRELLAYTALGVCVLPLALAPAWIMLELARPRDAAAHAFAALSLVTLVTMIVVTASFSVRFTAGINDRYLFFVAPLLTIGAVALLFDRRRATLPLLAGAALAAAILGTAVLKAQGPSIVSPTWGLNTVLQGRGPRLRDALGLSGLSAADLLALLTAAAVVALALARRLWPQTRWIAIGVSGALLFSSLLATRYVLNTIKQTQAGASQAFVDGRDWLDRSAPGDGNVGAVLSLVESPRVSAASWWDVSFWNKRIDRVWRLPDSDLYEQGFARPASVDPRTGRMAALDERSLLVVGRLDRRFALRGARTIADWGPFALVRAPRPYRAAWTLRAARDDGLLPTGRRAMLTLFGDGRRARRLRLRVSATATADAKHGYRLVARSASGRAWTARVAAGGHGTLRATVRVPAVGATRLRLTLRGPKGPSATTGVIVDGVVSRPAT